MKMDTKTYSKYFKAFGDPTRLKILHLLSSGELAVNEIADLAEISQPTASRHLGILRDADVLIDRREGQQVIYKLNKSTVRDCCSGFCYCLNVSGPGKKKKC